MNRKLDRLIWWLIQKSNVNYFNYGTIAYSKTLLKKRQTCSNMKNKSDYCHCGSGFDWMIIKCKVICFFFCTFSYASFSTLFQQFGTSLDSPGNLQNLSVKRYQKFWFQSISLDKFQSGLAICRILFRQRCHNLHKICLRIYKKKYVKLVLVIYTLVS